jgi:hypothetical protein
MSPDSINSTENPKSISNVVGNHADRVMDELFADIEDLLSGDVRERPAALTSSPVTGVAQPAITPTYPQLPPNVRVPNDSGTSQGWTLEDIVSWLEFSRSGGGWWHLVVSERRKNCSAQANSFKFCPQWRCPVFGLSAAGHWQN